MYFFELSGIFTLQDLNESAQVCVCVVSALTYNVNGSVFVLS